MNRGIAIIIGGLILTLASGSIWGYFVELSFISLKQTDLLPWHLSPGKSISRGFDTRDNSQYAFFLDYSPRGVDMNLKIIDSEEKIVLEEDLNDNYLDSPIKLEPNSNYFAKITNKGNKDVEVGGAGFLITSGTTEGENLDLAFDELYTIIPMVLFFVGIIVCISGGILFVKDRRKKSKSI